MLVDSHKTLAEAEDPDNEDAAEVKSEEQLRAEIADGERKIAHLQAELEKQEAGSEDQGEEQDQHQGEGEDEDEVSFHAGYFQDGVVENQDQDQTQLTQSLKALQARVQDAREQLNDQRGILGRLEILNQSQATKVNPQIRWYAGVYRNYTRSIKTLIGPARVRQIEADGS